MKKTVLEKENKYNEKKTKNLKVLGVATIYTLAISIGLSAAAFAVFNKLKKIELPTETPIETVTPTESIEPTETPIESIIPTESIEPTETVAPEPTMSYGERLIEKHLQRKTSDFENYILIWKFKINGKTKIIFTTDPEKDYNEIRFVRDIFSLTPIIVIEAIGTSGDRNYYGIGPFKDVTIEKQSSDHIGAEGVLTRYGIYGFELDDNTTLKDLQTAYYKYIKEEQRIEQLQYFINYDYVHDVTKWDKDYDGYKISNSNTDYTNNVTLSASSKESLNNKLIASGLLKQDSNTNIVEYQKILQKRA